MSRGRGINWERVKKEKQMREQGFEPVSVDLPPMPNEPRAPRTATVTTRGTSSKGFVPVSRLIKTDEISQSRIRKYMYRIKKYNKNEKMTSNRSKNDQKLIETPNSSGSKKMRRLIAERLSMKRRLIFDQEPR